MKNREKIGQVEKERRLDIRKTHNKVNVVYEKKNLNNIVRLCKTCKTIHINIINVSSYVLHFQKRGKMGPPWGDFLKKKGRFASLIPAPRMRGTSVSKTKICTWALRLEI